MWIKDNERNSTILYINSNSTLIAELEQNSSLEVDNELLKTSNQLAVFKRQIFITYVVNNFLNSVEIEYNKEYLLQLTDSSGKLISITVIKYLDPNNTAKITFAEN